MPEPSSRRGLTRAELVALLVGVPVVLVAIVAAKPLVSDVLDKILHLDPTMVYVTVGLLVFAEAALFFGFIFPGETAVILGGVAASGRPGQHRRALRCRRRRCHRRRLGRLRRREPLG